MSFGDFLTSALKFIPGVGQVASALELAGDIAGAVGGDTGKQIRDGLAQVTAGLTAASEQPLTPEQRADLEKAGHRHEERMARINLEDVQGGRDLAAREIASEDEYVRRTRPKLLRWVCASYLALCFLALPLTVAAAWRGDLSNAAADLITYVVCWLIGSVGAMLTAMYRAYVGRRTAEKLAEVGVAPEGLFDKIAKLRRVK